MLINEMLEKELRPKSYKSLHHYNSIINVMAKILANQTKQLYENA